MGRWGGQAGLWGAAAASRAMRGSHPLGGSVQGFGGERGIVIEAVRARPGLHRTRVAVHRESSGLQLDKGLKIQFGKDGCDVPGRTRGRQCRDCTQNFGGVAKREQSMASALQFIQRVAVFALNERR